MRKNKCLSTVCEYKSHVAEESGLRAMVGEWSGQSLSMRVVRTVPEHDGGLDSPQARWWSGQSPSTMVGWTVPEHDGAAKNQLPLVLLFCVFIYLLALSSPI